MQIFYSPIVFEWDSGNRDKNLKRHAVSDVECEEVFFDHYKKIQKDAFHSGEEPRYLLLGKTREGRLLFLVFTFRGQQVRVISARDLNRQERYLYEKET